MTCGCLDAGPRARQRDTAALWTDAALAWRDVGGLREFRYTSRVHVVLRGQQPWTIAMSLLITGQMRVRLECVPGQQLSLSKPIAAYYHPTHHSTPLPCTSRAITLHSLCRHATPRLALTALFQQPHRHERLIDQTDDRPSDASLHTSTRPALLLSRGRPSLLVARPRCLRTTLLTLHRR